MNNRKLLSAAIASVCATFAAPASASIVGYLDAVDVYMIDTAYGWVCDNWIPSQTPLGGTLQVYVDGNFQKDYPLTGGNWGSSRPDTAGVCNGYTSTGFSLSEWFWHGYDTTVRVYFRHNDGTMQQLGCGIRVTGGGRNTAQVCP